MYRRASRLSVGQSARAPAPATSDSRDRPSRSRPVGIYVGRLSDSGGRPARAIVSRLVVQADCEKAGLFPAARGWVCGGGGAAKQQAAQHAAIAPLPGPRRRWRKSQDEAAVLLLRSMLKRAGASSKKTKNASLLDKPADPTILSHRTVEPNLTARKLTSLATHVIPIPDKRGLTHRSRRLRGDIAT